MEFEEELEAENQIITGEAAEQHKGRIIDAQHATLARKNKLAAGNGDELTSEELEILGGKR